VSTTLILGGARSGKSRYAESLLRGAAAVTYVAPGLVPDGSDPEWAERISAHRGRRPAHWTTVETVQVPEAVASAAGTVLVDCLSTWLARLVDDAQGWDEPERAADVVRSATSRLLVALSAASVDVVLVSNEVGMGVVPATSSGRFFRDELGRMNAAVSAASDRVVLLVAGRVLDLSNAPVVDA